MLPQSKLRNQVGARLSDIRQWGAPHLRTIGERSHVPPAILSPGFLPGGTNVGGINGRIKSMTTAEMGLDLRIPKMGLDLRIRNSAAADIKSSPSTYSQLP